MSVILIESQWNLNFFTLLKKYLNQTHINRITVEFKLFSRISAIPLLIILIESQWNLNSITIDLSICCNFILIESQWNLNSEVPAFPAVTATY